MKQRNESIQSFALPFIDGVEVISGQNIINDFRRHIHKTYIIGIVTKGQRIINHADGTDQISENEIFIINPDQVHSCSSESPEHTYKILSISAQTMQLLASHISEKQGETIFFKNFRYKNELLCNQMIQLFDVIEAPEAHIQVESDLYSFLSYLLIHFSKTPPSIYTIGEQKDSIKRVCDFIRHNFTQNLSLTKLAEIACLSPFHFQREFKKGVGITPHEYLSDFRISKSKKMLVNAEDIAAVSVQLGFFDQSHFSRIFRKSVGVSPGKYTRTNQRPR